MVSTDEFRITSPKVNRLWCNSYFMIAKRDSEQLSTEYMIYFWLEKDWLYRLDRWLTKSAQAGYWRWPSQGGFEAGWDQPRRMVFCGMNMGGPEHATALWRRGGSLASCYRGPAGWRLRSSWIKSGSVAVSGDGPQESRGPQEPGAILCKEDTAISRPH